MTGYSASMKATFIVTVYNEESSIADLLQSLLHQTRLPDEAIIVDGGSTDATFSVISSFKPRFSNKKIRFKLITKEGNRSVGRNEAIRNSSNGVILCSDAGCILDKDWIKNITKPFFNLKIDVVAGYYEGRSASIFEKCLIPYVLVMPDRANESTFLPATRSMAFKKTIWERIGGFSEKFSNNEDYLFANNLRNAGVNMVFEKKAIVHWVSRKNIQDSFVMFYRFAKGDSETRIFRPKVALIFFRYVVALLLVLVFVISRLSIMLNILILIFLFYIFWAISKNYRYVKNLKAILYLPLIQFTSDIAVMLGTIAGLLTKRVKILIEGLIYISTIYLIILLNFRSLRLLINPQQNAKSDIVGYAQYFGYSLYFETIIFYIFIFSPLLVFFVLSKIRKYKK